MLSLLNSICGQPFADPYFMTAGTGTSDDARQAFIGEDAEILSNANWQNIEKNQ